MSWMRIKDESARRYTYPDGSTVLVESVVFLKAKNTEIGKGVSHRIITADGRRFYIHPGFLSIEIGGIWFGEMEDENLNKLKQEYLEEVTALNMKNTGDEGSKYEDENTDIVSEKDLETGNIPPCEEVEAEEVAMTSDVSKLKNKIPKKSKKSKK